MLRQNQAVFHRLLPAIHVDQRAVAGNIELRRSRRRLHQHVLNDHRRRAGRLELTGDQTPPPLNYRRIIYNKSFGAKKCASAPFATMTFLSSEPIFAPPTLHRPCCRPKMR